MSRSPTASSKETDSLRTGAVRAISDQALPAHPYATPASAAASGAASSSVPVQPGTQTLSVEVTVTYELAA